VKLRRMRCFDSTVAQFDSIVTGSVIFRTSCHDNFSYGFCKRLIHCGSFSENVGALSALKG
jgi:hypothetical protein